MAENDHFTPISEFIDPPVPIVDRYFTRFYKLGKKMRLGEDLCVLHHSNRLCIVTLAESHPIILNKKTVSSVNFKIDDKTNRLENKVSGKGKRGAQQLKEGSVLCHITCTDDSSYSPIACVQGSLVEVNENLVKNPQLLTEKTDTRGYIAIVLTSLNSHQRQMDNLLTEDQYKTALAARNSSANSTEAELSRDLSSQ